VFVGGLSAEVTDPVFSEYFEQFGAVKDAVVMVDRTTSRSRGFGFVTFENEADVEKVHTHSLAHSSHSRLRAGPLH
jgi:RNA-binding protein Musashi